MVYQMMLVTIKVLFIMGILEAFREAMQHLRIFRNTKWDMQ